MTFHDKIRHLVFRALAPIPLPYPEDITDLVFQAIETNAEWLHEYHQLLGEYNARRVNPAIGMETRHQTCLENTGRHRQARSSLTSTITLLGPSLNAARHPAINAAEPAPAKAPAANSVARPSRQHSEAIEIGPQYGGDTPFQRRMRFHQSYYRANVLRLPCGTGPHEKDETPYGSYLTHEDGARGLNFLTGKIYDVVQRRLAEGGGAFDPYRLKHNMLSSQPMCFNLFGPLVDDLDLATRCFRALFPDEVKTVARVTIEYAPEPQAEYLDDRTAFDAFVEFVRPDGASGFYGIETKLSDTFSPKVYDTPSYRRWMAGPDSPWAAGAETQVAAKAHNQLWRDHLLAVALRRRPASPYASGRFILVYYPGDDECAANLRGYQRLLSSTQDSLAALRLDHIIDAWAPVVEETPDEAWLALFDRRYLRLSESEALFARQRE